MSIGMLFFMLVIIGVFVLVLVGIAALVYWLIVQARTVPTATHGPRIEDDPLELARRRHDSGEISPEEYEIMREDLKV